MNRTTVALAAALSLMVWAGPAWPQQPIVYPAKGQTVARR